MENFISVKINFLIKDNMKLDLYLKIGEKFVKYSHSEDTHANLVSLKEKGLDDIYVLKNDYISYIDKKTQLIFDSRKNNDQKNNLKNIIEHQNLLNEVFQQIGFDSQKVNIAKKVLDETFTYLKETKNFNELFKKSINCCDSIQVKRQMVIFTGISLIRELDFSTQSLEKQYSLGVLICDGLLNDNEYWESFSDKTDSLSKKILNHSVDIIEKLPNDNKLFSPEIINFIKNHHEKPDGTGYPNKLNHQKSNLLLAIYQMSEYYIQNMVLHSFKSNMKEKIFQQTVDYFSKFQAVKSYNLALNSFKKIHNKEIL